MSLDYILLFLFFPLYLSPFLFLFKKITCTRTAANVDRERYTYCTEVAKTINNIPHYCVFDFRPNFLAAMDIKLLNDSWHLKEVQIMRWKKPRKQTPIPTTILEETLDYHLYQISNNIYTMR